ncbi:hypothetical protein AeMF1_018228 [Aphanomyces euteiches]|nr:hypothetical protein AeMF1_018228 [Aphanomyces euteiches]
MADEDVLRCPRKPSKPARPRRPKHVARALIQVNDQREDAKTQLLERMYAKGVKRTLHQAQLFPSLHDTKSLYLEPLVPLPPPSHDKTLVARRPSFVSAATSIKATVAAAAPESTKPQSPLSARDTYYLTTQQQHRRRRRLSSKQPAPDNASQPPSPAQEEATACGVPRRAQLLEKSTHLATFTESVEASILTRGIPKDSFLYLRRFQDNPYKLVVVDHAAIDPENYYMMSRAGLLHFSGSSKSTAPEFTYLETFEREHYLYSLVREIKFFQQYRLWKQFRQWRQAVRGAKRAHATQHLVQHLFFLRPTLYQALFRLRTLCYDMSLLRLFTFEASKQPQTWTLSEFCDRQQLEIATTQAQIQGLVQQIVDTTYETCHGFLSDFLVSNGFADNLSLANLPSILTLLGPPHSRGDAPTTPSKAAWANGRVVSFTERAAMRTQCRNITKLIRLVEFLVVDALIDVALMSTQYILDEMKQSSTAAAAAAKSVQSSVPIRWGKKGNAIAPPVKIVPLFCVEIHLIEATAELLFTPSGDDLRTELENVVFAGLKAATTLDRLMRHDVFRPFVQPSLDEMNGELSAGLNLQVMVVEDARFQATTQAISELVHESYAAVTLFSKSLTPFQDEFMENKRFCMNASAAQQDNQLTTTTANRSIDEWRDDLEKYTEQIERFDALADSAIVKLLLVDCRALHAKLKPSPRQCMQALHELIPAVAQLKNEELKGEISQAHDAIASIPTSVDEFAQALLSMRETETKMESMDDRYLFLKLLYGLTEEYNIQISDLDSTNAFMLAQKRAQLKTSMDLLDTSTETYTDKFSKDLDKKIVVLHTQIQERLDELQRDELVSDASDAGETLLALESIQERVLELESTSSKYVSYQKTLSLPPSSFDQLSILRHNLDTKVVVWKTLKEWTTQSELWREELFAHVDVAALEDKVAHYDAIALECDQAMPSNHLPVLHALKDSIDAFKHTLPIVHDLRCPALKEHHWKELSDMLLFDVLADPTLTLWRLIDMNMHDCAPSVHRIAGEAIQEKLLEDLLERITSLWIHLEFRVERYKDRKDIYIFGAMDDIHASLEESFVSLETILGSRFVANVKDEAMALQKRLHSFQDTLAKWTTCQKEWIYLDAIFSTPDMQRQLPLEAQAFAAVHSFWKDTMERTQETPNCMRATAQPGLGDTFSKHNHAMENLRKALEEYLETKRMAFPRFYFVSNDDLIDMLAHTKEPQALQQYLRQLFDGIKQLEFGDSGGVGAVDIQSMLSQDGERVAFGRNLKTRGNIEDWLHAVQVAMKATLQRAIKACIGEYASAPREEWLFRHPAQCVTTVAAIVSTQSCEAAFGVAGAMEKWLEQLEADLGALTRLLPTPLTNLQRTVVAALLLSQIHARDVVQQLVELQVDSSGDSTWRNQLRFMWNADADDAAVEQGNARIPYGFEYIGAAPRLVITPLTERCRMAITHALELKLGVALSGPLGVGKMETTRALAKAVAIHCVGFNCAASGTDQRSLATHLSGVAQCGAWTCLTAFQCVEMKLLSVVAQQLMTLRRGRLVDMPQVHFEGRTFMLKDFHVVVTMETDGNNVALPEHIQMCFRSMAVVEPDAALIAQVLTATEGFQDANEWSRRLVKLFRQFSELQLSSLPPQTFGLGAVKATIAIAGELQRQPRDAADSTTAATFFMRALRQVLHPKLIADDIPRLETLLHDVFLAPESAESSKTPETSRDEAQDNATT